MITHKGYAGKIEFDPDAGTLHGEVLGIRDVVTFEGSSVEEVLQAFRDSVDDYLEFCEQRGEKPDKPCSGKISLRITPDLHRRIAMVAKTSRVSINSLVSDCLAAMVAPETRATHVDSKAKKRSEIARKAAQARWKQVRQNRG